MKPGQRTFLIGAALSVLALALWGTLRFGTAAELFPEKKETPAPAASDELPEPAEETGGRASLKYDAARYRRAAPLADPFRMEAIAAGKKDVTHAEHMAGGNASAESLPILRGTMRGAGGARALLEIDGQQKTVKEGEWAGVWTVVKIGKKNVVLDGPAGERTLSL